MQPMVSIIVPVYRSEQYLEKCVNSLLCQLYPNIEILLIDDGSPDNCPRICDDLSQRDQRIKVFHKSNGGASSARNMGLDHAQGDYICFVDSDDLVPSNGIIDLLHGIHKSSCQYVAGICGILQSHKVKNLIKEEKVIKFENEADELLNYITTAGSYSPYAKMFEATIIKQHHIRFDETLKCSEDALFIREYLCRCTSVLLIPKAVYFYNTMNESSLSKKRYSDFSFYYLKKMSALETLVTVLQISDDKKIQFLCNRAIHGLEISIKHYISNWEKRNESIKLILKSIDCFEIWVNMTIDKNVKIDSKWWRKYASKLNEGNVGTLYRRMKLEMQLKKLFLSFGIKAKRLINKIGRKNADI